MKSVLQDWVMELPLREQGTLLCAVRNCDVAEKPLTYVDGENPARDLTCFLRWCIWNPADEREIDVPGALFKSKPPTDWKPSQLGHLPQHYYSHLMHAYEVVAYRHPGEAIAAIAFYIYRRLVHNMHLNIETSDAMIKRLSEDRIANGTVVS
jgi:hypothetical protein